MNTFDLQMHSTASDGALRPAALVKKARELNIAAIALTDHDTVAGLEEAMRA
ncbi:MAG: PHP domain-containing protein, partial [Candidatus Sungbacteria bacterium]|nr:PHP domain-containing protein [Candidatus Sungbacteria bacterium]